MSRIVTTGTFDGVHRGHALLLDFLAEEARGRGLKPLAVTFDRHPLEVIAPGRAPGLLIHPEGRDALIRAHGVEVATVPFDADTRALSSRQWMQRLADRFGASALVMGYDNTLGSDGLSLSLEDYRAIGAEMGLEVLRAPVLEGVSSSAVRRAVADGRVEDAARMLGRPYEMSGMVVGGKALGRTLGFPTANLRPEWRYQWPAAGVYAADALLPDGSLMRAAVNVGRRPSVDLPGAPVSIEAHIIGFDGNLYGEPLTLRFLKRLRPEQKFNSLSELEKAIAADVRAAESL